MALSMDAKVVAKAVYRPNVGTKRTDCIGDVSGQLSNSRNLVQGYKASVVAHLFLQPALLCNMHD